MKRPVKCPFCAYKAMTRTAVEHHIEDKHGEELPPNVSAAQALFNIANRYPINQEFGKSAILRKPTLWNPLTKRYNRFSSPKEKEMYVSSFQQRMKKTYGKTHLLDDPDVQRHMLASRKISGTYKFGNTEFPYTGSYEEHFVQFMDKELNWDPNDLIMPAPVNIPYTFEGKDRIYIPDAYIPSLNLIIEIKASDNQHYRKRDLPKELEKDKTVSNTLYNYLKIFDKNYNDFVITMLGMVDTLED